MWFPFSNVNVELTKCMWSIMRSQCSSLCVFLIVFCMSRMPEPNPSIGSCWMPWHPDPFILHAMILSHSIDIFIFNSWPIGGMRLAIVNMYFPLVAKRWTYLCPTLDWSANQFERPFKSVLLIALNSWSLAFVCHLNARSANLSILLSTQFSLLDRITHWTFCVFQLHDFPTPWTLRFLCCRCFDPRRVCTRVAQAFHHCVDCPLE